MPRKLILCRCEDVTAADVDQAVAAGFADLEEVKRYTGFGTGPCQGKECLRGVALQIAAAAGRAAKSLRPFTTRPPLVPTELGLLVPGDRAETSRARQTREDRSDGDADGDGDGDGAASTASTNEASSASAARKPPFRGTRG